eukprot:15431725-Alexandrium_andersonii.AAC.1
MSSEHPRRHPSISGPLSRNKARAKCRAHERTAVWKNEHPQMPSGPPGGPGHGVQCGMKRKKRKPHEKAAPPHASA